MLPQTTKLLKELREINKSIGDGLKINEWVGTYLDAYKLESRPVTLISPWSLSKGFEKRYVDQGNTFLPTKGEIKLFQKEIPRIVSLFKENGFEFDWWIIFSRSYIDERVIPKELEDSYIQMIQGLVEEYEAPVGCINWEDDVILKRHAPNPSLCDSKIFEEYISKERFEYELARWQAWATEIRLQTTNAILRQQTRYQIACEAEEGRFLMEDSKNPLSEPGQFLFMPLGRAERYVFFSTIATGFEKRIVSVLKQYPWRL